MVRYARFFSIAVLVLAPLGKPTGHALAEETAAQQSLKAAADAGQYAIVVFHKDQGPATASMVSTVQNGVQQRPGRATAVVVNASLGNEKALVDRFGLARTPMPVAVAVAPNGAITGIYAKTISDERLAKAFVSPGVADCIKWMQAGKLVFVWARSGSSSLLPACVEDFQRDAEFAGRSTLVTLDQADAAEADFFKQLGIDTSQRVDAVGLLAPPGVLVGTFGVNASKGDVAAALHKAGKCCDDPNCKHNRAK
jgi:hypothetical protein